MTLANVLIADDHYVTRRGMRDIILEAFEGALVYEAADFPAVIAQLPNRTWDLLLLDLFMPGANPIDALRTIRSTNATVPILLLTAVEEIEYVFETMRAGANGLIHKNRAVDELVYAITKVTEGGTYMHPETAITIAATLREKNTSLLHERLSERELEIFRHIAKGRAVKEIAGQLGLSEKTVATYLARIREKTGLQSHVDIARYALQHQLVE
jgi:DNA-binding NarL/FixJ family response regulator